jgi:predicted DNA-binding protein (MmcQ/YjbR family)
MNRRQLDLLCLSWPGVTSDIKWGEDLVYSVAAKMIAVLWLEGDHFKRISFKVPDELFLALTEQPGIAPAPYLARHKWISLTDPAAFGDDWLASQLRISYELVAAKLPQKTRQSLSLPTARTRR